MGNRKQWKNILTLQNSEASVYSKVRSRAITSVCNTITVYEKNCIFPYTLKHPPPSRLYRNSEIEKAVRFFYLTASHSQSFPFKLLYNLFTKLHQHRCGFGSSCLSLWGKGTIAHTVHDAGIDCPSQSGFCVV